MTSLYSLSNIFYKISKRFQINKAILNSLPSFAKREKYLQEELGLEYMGEGSARAVYLVNQAKVIKLAKNQAGQAQNRVEFDNLQKYGTSILPKFYDMAPDYSWIEVELVRPATKTQFNLATGIPFAIWQNILLHLKRLQSLDMLDNFGSIYDFLLDYAQNYNEELIDSLKHMANSQISQIIQMIVDGATHAGDLFLLDHYGIAADGRLVILDVGLNQNVYSIYYESGDSQKHYSPEQPPKDIKFPPTTYVSRDPKNVFPRKEDDDDE